jgi:PAS domain S-box-containing protein
LKDAELRFHSIVDNGIGMIWTAGVDKGCTYFNLPWLRFTGRRLEQELGTGWTEGVHPEDFDACMTTYCAAFDRREKFSMVYRLHRHDGAYRWILDEGMPRFGTDGAFLGYVGHCLDITEQKQNEFALEESNDRYRRAAATIPMALYDYARDGEGTTHLYRISPRLAEILEIDPAAVVDDPCLLWNVIHPEDVARVRDEDEQAARSGRNFDVEFRVICPSGKIKWLQMASRPYQPAGGVFDFGSGYILDISDRKTAERRQIHAVMEAFPEAMLMLDADGIIHYANSNAEPMFGVTAGELVGRNIEVLLPENVAEILETARTLQMPRKIASTSGVTTEAVAVRGDGSIFPVDLRVSRMLLDNEPTTIVSALDISERKRDEKALEKSERFLRILTDNLPGMVGYWNKDLRNEFANIAYREWFGKSPAEMKNIPIQELLGRELFALNEPFLRKALGGKRQTFERMLMKVDGSKLHTWAQYIPDWEGGEVRGIFVLVTDVTDLVHATEALRESEERWRFALEGSGDGVWDWNYQTGSLFLSRQEMTVLGLDGDEATTCHVTDRVALLHPDDKIAREAALARYLAGETPIYTCEFRTRDRLGRWKWIYSRGMLVSRTPDGKPLRLLGTHSDITSVKLANQKLERLLEENRQLMAKIFSLDEIRRRQLSQDLHDELGQWIAAIQANAHFVSTRPADTRVSQTADAVQAIIDCAKEINGVIRNMVQRLRPALLDTLGLKASLLDLVSNWNKIFVSMNCQVEIADAVDNLADDVLISIYRIVQESLSNIGKHSRASSVIVCLRFEETAANDFPEAHLCIEDDGVGFAGETSGVGLLGIRERTLSIGGRLTIDSAPEQGCRIDVRIPIGHRDRRKAGSEG